MSAAQARHLLGGLKRMSFNIVDKEPPALPEDFSNEARHFVSLCLTKDQESRPGSDQLLQHPFILVNQAAPVVQWLTSL
jgi:serine/threonine protein kinase